MKLLGRFKDPDSTEKYVFQDDHGTIEITRINTKPDRDIFCVPSLYGCTLGCSFCFLTTLKITNNNKKINYSTIKECLRYFENPKPDRQISIMGVGDPSLNLEMVQEACLNETRVSIATIMPFALPKLPKNLKIHYSLHTPISHKRLEIMPSAKLPVEDAVKYLSQHEGEKEIHYTLISGVNDSFDELSRLESIVNNWSLPVKFLTFKESGDLKRSKNASIWEQHFMSRQTTEFYNPPGEKIQGSCGMFTKEFYQNGTTPEALKEYAF
jgi:adenine C2-methylase RlmN of 23S rRNA A2503 and tRNA A37